MKFLNSGEGEKFKALYHTSLLVLLTGAFAYNLFAYRKRKDHHLAINAAIYGAGMAIETLQVKRHLEHTK